MARARTWLSPALTALVAGLALVAFATRILNAGVESLWWDETLSYHRASAGLLYALSNQMELGHVVTVDQHPPLYFAVLSAVLAIAGKSEFVLRFPSVAFSVIAVPLGYVTGARLAGRTAGMAMAALGASSPFLLWAAQEARPYALLVLLSLLSVYLLLRSIDTKHAKWTIAWGASLVALFFTHYMASLLIGSEITLVIILLSTRHSKRPLLVAGILLALASVAVPSTPFVLGRLQSLNPAKANLSVGTVVRDVADTYTIGDASSVLPASLLTVPLIIVLAGALLTLLQRRRRRAIVVVAFALVLPLAAMYVLASWGYLPFNTSRYVAFAAPGYFLLFALGLARLAELRPVLGWIMLTCLLGIGLAGVVHAQSLAGSAKQDLRGTSAYIVENAREDDAVVLASARVTATLQYYGVGPLDTYLLRMPRDGASADEMAAQLAVIAQGHRRMWILTDYWEHYDDQSLLDTLDQSNSRKEKTTFTRPGYAQYLYLYQASPHVVDRLPQEAVPLDARVGDSMHLLGYTIEPSSTRRGRLYVRLFWQITAPVQRLSVFGQLVDGDGKTWASFDGEPFGGFFPTTAWKAGDTIVDERRLDAEAGTPPGQYTVRVGMRRWATKDALPVVTPGSLAQESAPLGSITLQGLDRADGVPLSAGVTPLRASAGHVELLAAKAPFADRYPGETVPLRLYWKLSSNDVRLDQTTVRLALLSPEGKPVAASERAVTGPWDGSSASDHGLLAGDYALQIPRVATAGDYTVAVALHRFDQGYWRFSSPWWLPDPEWIVVSAVRVHGFSHLFDIPQDADGVRTDVGSFAELAAVKPGPEWIGERDSNGELILRAASSHPSVVPLTLYWRARSETQDDVMVFLQLLDANGRLVAQDDSRPQSNRRPTSSWLSFEVIEDPHALRGLESLRAGRYTLIAGLYDAATGKRLMAPTRDYVLLGSVLLP